jgi:hypothetical protein
MSFLKSKAVLASILLLGTLSGISFLVPIANAEKFTSDEFLEFATIMGMIEGHMEIATEQAHAKNYDSAKMHLAHPIGEHYDSLKKYFDGHHEYRQKLELVLSIMKNSNAEGNEQNFIETLHQIYLILDKGKHMVLDDKMDDPIFKMNVVKNLLNEAEKEYDTGMNLSIPMEIQDSHGFTVSAYVLFSTIDFNDAEYKKEFLMKFLALYVAHGDKVPTSEMTLLYKDLTDDLDFLLENHSSEITAVNHSHN